MRKSTEREDADPDLFTDGPGGEGGSLLRNLLASPSSVSDALTPNGLLAVSLLLSILLVGLVTAAVAY